MASSQKQLEEVKAALAALQEEIQKGYEKVVKAEERLEKATLEGKPADISADLKVLLESATANLTRLGQKQAELQKRETKLTHSHSSSDEETQEISPVSDSTAKDKRARNTFSEQENGGVSLLLEVGDELDIWVSENDAHYNVKVLKINVESDWILLESEADLCDEEPKKAATADGRRYFQLGLSATLQQDSPFSVSEGVVSSSRLSCFNKLGHMLGSAGANPGGGCFDSAGCLESMLVWRRTLVSRFMTKYL